MPQKRAATSFDQEVLRLRKKMGLSQEKLGESLGLSRYAIAEWEKGNFPRSKNLKKLIQLILQKGLFTPKKEEKEIRRLWHLAHPDRSIDEYWLKSTLSYFNGRNIVELNQLKQWIISKRWKVINIIGAEGPMLINYLLTEVGFYSIQIIRNQLPEKLNEDCIVIVISPKPIPQGEYEIRTLKLKTHTHK